ncbi:MAG: YbfB/YjiJ family MFS transporter [Xanthobacteraceae bacterium]|nr:YbfB/YjiJ family MFS transporter [Xanthobacteraceae bacterium]
MSASPDSPQDVPKPFPVALILWGAAGMLLNVGIARFTYGVMLPSLRRDLGLDLFASGSLNAFHLAGYLIGTLLAPSLGRCLPPWRMARAAHLIVVAGAIACALAPASALGFSVLAAGRLATGIGAGIAIVATFVIVFEAVSAAKRPLVSAVVWSGLNVGIVGSGLCVAPLLETALGWRVAFGFAALLALTLAIAFPPAGYRTERGVSAFAAEQVTLPEKMISPRWLFLGGTYLCFGVGYVAYSTFAGVRLTAINASAFTIGTTWTVLGLASMIGSFATIPVLTSERLKRIALLVAMSFGAFGSFVAAGGSSVAAIAGAAFIGFGLASVPTIVSAYARDRTDAQSYPRAFSIVTAFLGIGQLIGPTVGGAVGDWLGSGAIPLFAAAAFGTGALLAALDAFALRRG